MTTLCPHHEATIYQIAQQALSLSDHEKRLRMLEKNHWRMTAVVTIITALCSATAAAGGAILVALLKP